MKLLIISNNLDRASYRQRVGIYLDMLHQQGITCEVKELPEKRTERMRLFASAKEFNAVFLQKKRLNAIDAFFLRKHSRKIIYDFDDAVMYDPNEPDRTSISHYLPFRRTVRLADLIIAGNSYLAQLARKFNSNVEVLATGLYTKAYQLKKKAEADGKIRLVWIGSKSTLGYLQEIASALEVIGESFNNVVLRIICDDFFDLKNMQVEKRSWSLDAQVPDLATADIGLSPLPDNRFTRGKCAFKILQYQASGLPSVDSPVGTNAEYIQEGIDGFFAKNSKDWIDKISCLIEQPLIRSQMGQAAQKKVQNFDISIISGRLYQIIFRSLQT